MTWRAFVLLAVAAVAALPAMAEKRTSGSAQGSNADVAVSATAYVGRDGVGGLLGNDLGGFIVVVDVQLKPQGGKKLAVARDDFQLRSDVDGEKAKPFTASQIAGRGAMVVGQLGPGNQFNSDGGGPVILRGGGATKGAGKDSEKGKGQLQQAATASTMREKRDPIQRVLESRMLAESETSEPVSGLLYFPMDGKLKIKDLQLTYKTASGPVVLRFR